MQRFLTIILCVTLYLMWGVSDNALSLDNTHKSQTSDYSATTNNECSLRKQQQTVLSQSVATTSLSSSHSNATSLTPTTKAHSQSSRASARKKIESNKLLSAAIHSRLAGHLTIIFEYNHFRSSLRVAYYLHTLCRLRI